MMSGNIGGDEDPRNEEELKQYLLDRIARLESRNMELKEHARQLDIEKKNIESQKIRYEREIRKLKSEIEKLISEKLGVEQDKLWLKIDDIITEHFLG